MSLFTRNTKPRGSDVWGAGQIDRYRDHGVPVDDVMVLQQLVGAGADLSRPRHVIYFVYFDDPTRADDAAGRAGRAGYRAKSSELPGAYAGTWSLNAEAISVLDPATVIEAGDLFRSIAGQCGGDYDGWEASVVSMSELPVE